MSLNAALDVNFTAIEMALINDLERLAAIILKHGYSCRAHSPKALVNLKTLSVEKKQLLQRQVNAVLNIILYTPEQPEIPANEHPERAYVEQALKMYDLETDEDFWDKLQKDDVIEVYSSENIQLFRTFNFFKISSYSLLDLLTNEWYHLWERPTFVLGALFQEYTEAMAGKFQKARQVNVACHILKEIYNDESIDFKTASVLVEPGIGCPLFEKGTRHVRGFLFSLRGQVMGYDNEANKIAMI
ncbi:MAG: hypothetical protein NDI63_09630 [Pseudobdellovibrio sp.]|nr:hypothetical protein [Pseudobdellovibrio sp.]